MALSTDLGAHWRELSVPTHNGIYYASPDQYSLDFKHMVIAGKDSLGRIVQSFDGGEHWQCDTVPLGTGLSHHIVFPYAVTGSGRLIAAVTASTAFIGSNSLNILEPLNHSAVSAGVADPLDVRSVYPNPASKLLTLPTDEGVSIFDALGREVHCRRDGASLDISSLPPGVYSIESKTYRSRFVKE